MLEMRESGSSEAGLKRRGRRRRSSLPIGRREGECSKADLGDENDLRRISGRDSTGQAMHGIFPRHAPGMSPLRSCRPPRKSSMQPLRRRFPAENRVCRRCIDDFTSGDVQCSVGRPDSRRGNLPGWACQADLRDRNRSCIAFTAFFRGANSVCRACTPDFRDGNGSCIACQADFRDGNRLGIACRADFYRVRERCSGASVKENPDDVFDGPCPEFGDRNRISRSWRAL